MNQSNHSLTEGNLYKSIIFFAVPIFIGNLFQQLYNIVDALVVGQFEGTEALAAISSTGSLIFLLVGFFGGVFTGVGVVISRFFGAKDQDMTEKSIGTAIAIALVSGLILTIIGVLFTPSMLTLMGTPDSVFPQAVLYVRTYFTGIVFIVLYNAAAGIFQALGDSRHPLYYLMISAVTNILLDLLFVGACSMGVFGAALATVIAQALSAFLAYYRLFFRMKQVSIKPSMIRFHSYLVKQMIVTGLPAGLQNSMIAIANLVVQSNINVFGDTAMAGCGSYSKIEGFVFIPITSFMIALTTFISQNLGARQYDRVKKGAIFGVVTSCLMAEAFGIFVWFFADKLLLIFSDDPAVIAIGTLQAHTITLFYCLLAFTHSLCGILRGAQKAAVPMIIMFFAWCLFRITYIITMTHFFHHIQVIFWAYPITWSLSSILFIIYYKKTNFLKKAML